MTAVADQPAATAPAATSEGVALERATKWANDYAARLTEGTERKMAELAGRSNGVQPRIGEPTVGPYVAFDVVATSPIQVGGPPPYQPSKIIAAGGAEGVDEAEEDEAAAVDTEHGRPGLVADRDVRVPGRALPHGDLTAAVTLHPVARAEPAAEHGDDLTRRHVLPWHPYLRHELKRNAVREARA